MSYLLEIGAIGIATLFILSRVVQRRYNWGIVNLFLFASYSILGLVTSLDTVQLTVDTLLNIHHLTWFISRVSLILSVHTFGIFWLMLAQRTETRWMHLTVTSVIALITLLFVGFLAHYPNPISTNVIPIYPPVLTIQLLMLGYAIGVIGGLGFLFWPLMQTEADLSMRLRWGVVFITVSVAGSTLLVIKALSIILLNFDLIPPAYTASLIHLKESAQLLGLWWPLSFLPQKVYQAVVYPYIIIKKVQLLHHLSYAARLVSGVVEVQPSPSVSWWQKVRQIDHYLYETYITILDGTGALAEQKAGLRDDLPAIIQQQIDTYKSLSNRSEQSYQTFDLESYQAQLQLFGQIGKSIQQSGLVNAYEHPH